MKEYFYTITESMLDLGLKGTELNLFAIIYGYSQRGDGICYVSRPELAKRCGVASIRTIDATIRSLINKGLILKETYKKGDLQMTGYKYNSPRANSAPTPLQNLHPTPVQKLHSPRANSAPMENKEENKEENKKENIKYIPPTPKEVADYVRSRGWSDPEGFAKYYVSYHTESKWHMSNGKPIRNWKLNVVAWEPNNKNRYFSRPSFTPSPKAPSPAMQEVSFEELTN